MGRSLRGPPAGPGRVPTASPPRCGAVPAPAVARTYHGAMSTGLLGRGAREMASWSPVERDAVLYAASALFAIGTAQLASISLYQQWGRLAVGPYAAGAVASAIAAAARRRERAAEPAGRGLAGSRIERRGGRTDVALDDAARRHLPRGPAGRHAQCRCRSRCCGGARPGAGPRTSSPRCPWSSAPARPSSKGKDPYSAHQAGPARQGPGRCSPPTTPTTRTCRSCRCSAGRAAPTPRRA